MGTSKGYIPPTTIPWKKAKRAVTAFRNEPLSSELMQTAVANFVKARSSSRGSDGQNFIRTLSGVSGILGAFSSGSVNSYLSAINRTDLVGKTSREIFDALLYQFTENGSSSIDRILLYSVTQVLDNLGVVTDEDFVNISPEEFLLDFLTEYICNDFDRCFEEQLRKDVLPAEYDTIHASIHGYIRNTIFSRREELDLQRLNFTKLQDGDFTRSMVSDTYQMFSNLYAEGDVV